MKKIPAFVRGMVVRAVEESCRKNGFERVTVEELEKIRARMPTPKLFGIAAPQARPAGPPSRERFGASAVASAEAEAERGDGAPASDSDAGVPNAPARCGGGGGSDGAKPPG
jgi:hypothetical protein